MDKKRAFVSGIAALCFASTSCRSIKECMQTFEQMPLREPSILLQQDGYLSYNQHEGDPTPGWYQNRNGSNFVSRTRVAEAELPITFSVVLDRENEMSITNLGLYFFIQPSYDARAAARVFHSYFSFKDMTKKTNDYGQTVYSVEFPYALELGFSGSGWFQWRKKAPRLFNNSSLIKEGPIIIPHSELKKYGVK